MKKGNKDNTNFILGSGITLGALTAAEFALIGAACPACVVGAPFLVGIGIAKKIQNKNLEKRELTKTSNKIS